MEFPLIIETAGRLPGPLASSILVEHGLEVIKLEHHIKRDPFSIDLKNQATSLFNFWYQNLKKGKAHFILTDLTEDFFQHLSKSAQKKTGVILITGGPKDPLDEARVKIEEFCQKESVPFCAYSILSDPSGQALHDLDLCAEVEIVNSNQIRPLRYPVMGMQFANRIALKALTENFDEKERVIFFKKEISQSYAHLKSTTFPTPIEGQMAAYNTYEILDGAIALTALEKRNWIQFCQLIDINLTEEDRFASPESVPGTKLKNQLKKITQNELKKLFSETGQCFTFVR